MSRNILRNLHYREVGDDCNSKQFFTSNYFNEGMMSRLRVEKSVSIVNDTSSNVLQCCSWNNNGSLLCYGQYSKGVLIFQPFQACKKKIPISQGHFLVDSIFLSSYDRLLATATRSYSNAVWDESTGLCFNEKLKIWDVEKAEAVRFYNFKGFMHKVSTSRAAPNCLWLNKNPRIDSILEVDIRDPGYRSFYLSERSEANELSYKRFDVNPVNERIIMIGENNRVCFYDRRTMTSQSPTKPFKTIDTGTLDKSALVRVGFSPDGRNVLLTKVSGLSPKHFINTQGNDDFLELKMPMMSETAGMMTGKSCFLGDRHVIFDTYFRNHWTVFEFGEGSPRCIGSIEAPHNPDFTSNVLSMAHPLHCLIAVANQGFIHYISPTAF